MAGRAASKRRGHKLVLRGHRALRVEPQHRKRRPRARAPWKQGPDQRRDSASGGSLGLDGRAQARGPRGNASGRSGAERAVRRTQCARGDFRGTSRKRKRPGRQRQSTARAQRHHPPGALSGKNQAEAKSETTRNGRALRVTPTIRPESDFARPATCALCGNPCWDFSCFAPIHSHGD